MASRGLTVVSTIPSSSTSHKSSRKSHQQLLRFGLTSSFRGTKLPVIPSSFNLVASNRRLSIVCNLPTTIEPVAADKKPKWSATAIKAFSMGVCEGLKFKYKATGTEALLMGIMIEGTSEASNFLRAHGFTLFEVRDATVKLRGIGDYYDPPPMDPPLSKRAQKALDWAVEAKLKSGESGELTTTHMLLGIWSVKESVGYKLLARLGLDDEKAKELAKTVNINLDLL